MKPHFTRRQTQADQVSTKLGDHIAIVHKTLALAARSVLPAYRIIPTIILFWDIGLPSGPVVLKEVKLRFIVHL